MAIGYVLRESILVQNLVNIPRPRSGLDLLFIPEDARLPFDRR